MADRGWDKESSPYHPGEQELHERLGRKDSQEAMARQIHRTYLTPEHSTFYNQLPFIVAGSVDAAGWPWASILFGAPGFVSAPDPHNLTLGAAALPGDPFAKNATKGAPVGFVGIELPTRRRNRVNGVVRRASEAEVLVDVVQAFGNCPQYIHSRDLAFRSDPANPGDIAQEHFTTLDDAARKVIANADTFFVASHNPRDDLRDTGGVDVNHRGGNPGFVKVEGDSLTIPDFIGNFAFNTLGNFQLNPKAGLLFIDFDSGDLLQLVGEAELLWDKTDEVAAFQGAERAWRFHMHHGQRLVSASPMRFQAGEASPNTRLTGDWAQANDRLEAKARRSEWRPFRVTKTVDESNVIRSFYLEPVDGKALLAYEPGQHLAIKATPDGAEVIRTYTLSSAPSDPFYRISVKREDEGVVSKHLHDTLKVDDVIDTRAPKGGFWMDTSEDRPAVLIAGGVGVTPMISMARQAVSDGFARRHLRPLTVFHAANTVAERAFLKEFSTLQTRTQGQLRYVSVIANPQAGEEAGKDFHVGGRLSLDILQSVLVPADYDFYLCGPPGFMQAVYDMLLSLGVRDARIYAEAFGPASLTRATDSAAPTTAPDEPDQAPVRFASSGIERDWTPADGTLLEFAEAQGFTPLYSCRSGACGSCSTKLLRGKVAYRTEPTVEPEEGYALICCAIPANADEVVELDI